MVKKKEENKNKKLPKFNTSTHCICLKSKTKNISVNFGIEI